MERLSGTLKTGILLGVMTVIIMLMGQAFGGRTGLYVAFAIAVAVNFFSYWFSDRMVLAMFRAREASPSEHPEVFRLVESLSRRAGLPMPRIFLIPQDSPNAFATGRDPRHAALGITRGLLRLLSPEELEGVLAHELGHVRNRDVLVSTIAATLAAVIMYLGRMLQFATFFGGSRDREGDGSVVGALALAVLAPIAALLVQMAISRSREYQADATGARMAGQPFGLASALEKLSMASRSLPMQASPATSHLFIVHPLSGGFSKLFSTHPPLEERIRRLRGLEYPH